MAKGGATSGAGVVSGDDYSGAVDAAELLTIRLIKSEFSALPEAYNRDQSNWKRSYAVEAEGVGFSASRDRMSGSVLAEALCRIGRKRVLALKCRYLVDYAITGAPTEGAAQSFFARVGVFAAYPYFRAHFAEVTSQAGILLGPLPVHKEDKRQIPKRGAGGESEIASG